MVKFKSSTRRPGMKRGHGDYEGKRPNGGDANATPTDSCDCEVPQGFGKGKVAIHRDKG